MTSWEIIKNALVSGRENSFGRQDKLNKAIFLFGDLRMYLQDVEEAAKELNEDLEVEGALANKSGIDEFKETMGWD